MFENIGEKIKVLAKVLTGVGIAICTILGIRLITSDRVVIGFLVILLGIPVSWAASFVLYGFGELVDSCQTIARQLSREERDGHRFRPEPGPSVVDRWVSEGLITEEDRQNQADSSKEV